MFSGPLDTMPPESLADLQRTKHTSVVEITVRPIQDILGEEHVSEIHYLSIDTEGSEPAILNNIDFDKCFIHVIGVEDSQNERKADAFLKQKGFVLVHYPIFDKIFVNTKSPFYTGRRFLIIRAKAAMADVFIGSAVDRLVRPAVKKLFLGILTRLGVIKTE